MNFKKHKQWSGLLLSIILLFSLFFGGCGNVQTDNYSQNSDKSVVFNTGQAAENNTETDILETADDAAEETITDELNQLELQSQEDASKDTSSEVSAADQVAATSPSVDELPAYEGYEFVEINNNQPYFSDADKQRTDTFEDYSELDDLGRCGVAYANICKDLMPTEPRGKIGMIKPSGWHTVKYNDIIDGNYLYNRCHLIGFQLAGENANPKNLITGTRYLNVVGMLPFENAIDDYVDSTKNHVLYRVTPIFSGDDLVAKGVLMEAYSVEDQGEGIQFCYFVYNIQPGIAIDYASGDSREDASVIAKESSYRINNTNTQQAASENAVQKSNSDSGSSIMVWISATGSKYHSKNNCGRMNPNKATQMTEQEAISQGYGKCSKCW